MPKKRNPWTYKKRRKAKKGKKVPAQETEQTNSQVPDPDDSSLCIDVMSEIPVPNDNPVKIEDASYPDTRFHRSTTLFPAEEVENITPSEKSSESLKRGPENGALATPTKKPRLNDLPVADECMIIETPKPQVKVELVDLTDESQKILPVVCSPVRTSYLENRLPGKMKTSPSANVDAVRVKVEPSEKTSEVNNDVDDATANGPAMAANTEKNKASDVNMSHGDVVKDIDPPMGILPQNQIKTEKNHMRLRSEVAKENNNNNETPISNNVQQTEVCMAKNATVAKTSDGHLPINVHVKVEQNEKSSNSTSVSNIPSDVNSIGMYPVGRQLRSAKNNTNENSKISSVCDAEIPNVINKQQTIERVNNSIEKCSITQENSIRDESNKDNLNHDKPQNYIHMLQKNTNANNKSTNTASSETSLIRVSTSPNTGGSIFRDDDSQLYEPGTFETPLLKYLNCNRKLDVLQLSYALSVLNAFLGGKEGIDAIVPEVITNSSTSQDKLKLFLTEERERLPTWPVEEKQSTKSVEEIVNEMSTWPNLKEIVNLKLKETNVASNSASSQSVNERRVERSLKRNEKQQNNSSNKVFDSFVKLTEASRSSVSNSHITNFKAPTNNQIPFKDNCPSVNSVPSLEQNEHSVSSSKQSIELLNQVERSLNRNERKQNNSSNKLLGSFVKLSEESRSSDSNSPTPKFNASMNYQIPFKDNCPSVSSVPSLEHNEPSATSNKQSTKAKKNTNDKFSNDFLREILVNVKTTEKRELVDKRVSEIRSESNSSVDPKNSNIFIDESVFKTLREISLLKNKPAENTGFNSNLNKTNSELNVKNSDTVPENLPVPRENFKRTHFNPPEPYDGAIETRPKKVKKAQDASTSVSGNVKKLSFEEYKKRDTLHNSQDRQYNRRLSSDFPSNSLDSAPGSSYFEQNMSSPRNLPNHNLLFGSATNFQNPGQPQIVNANKPLDPRLARTLHRDANFQKQLGPYDSQNVTEATKSAIHSHVRQTPVSTLHPMQNSNANELFRPTGNAVKSHLRPEINGFHPPEFNHRTSEKSRPVLLPTPNLENSAFSMTHQSMKSRQHLTVPHLPVNTSSPSSEFHHSVSQKLSSHMSRLSTPTHDYNSSECANRELLPNPPLPTYSPPPLPPSTNREFLPNPPQPTFNSPPLPSSTNREFLPNPLQPTFNPPPLPSTSSIVDKSHLIASKTSTGSLFHNHKKHAATKHLLIPKQPSSDFNFETLLPRQLNLDVGRNIIQFADVYLIIIERNVDWILGIDKDSSIPRISETGWEFHKVRDIYENHLTYYNTYFPLLLLDYFSKVSNALKGIKTKERMDKNLCKVVKCESKPKYVSFTCDSFIRQSEVENIPKEGHVVLVKFATVPAGSVRILGYVHSSATRAYSHKYDHAHEILRYMNSDNTTDLIKVKIIFYIVFAIPGINITYPINITKLTSVKKGLFLNDALRLLPRSPLCDIVLNPQKQDIKSVSLPRRQDTSAMTDVVKGIVDSLTSFIPCLTLVKTAAFTDPLLAIVQIVEEIQQSKTPGKILVCVRTEMLSLMGMNLLETSSNLVIINREREALHEKLHNRVLDGMISQMLKQNIPDDVARSKVLQEAEVLLVVTGTCFYEDVQCYAKDLTYCIIHDAQSFTEPESLLPLLYGVRHLLLFGDPEEACHVSSKCATSLGYNRSLFHRACKFF